MKVLGIGNALVDALTQIDDEKILSDLGFERGSMTLVDAQKNKEIADLTSYMSKTLASGGSAANTIHGMAELGLETAFIGRVGDDEFGRFYTKDMEKAGIKPLLTISQHSTGMANAFISKDGERTFGTFLGAAVELSPDDLTIENFKGFDVLHIEGYLVQNNDLIEKAVKLAKQAGLKVSLDMASFNVVEANLDFLKRIATDYTDILFANEEEAKSFTGKEPEEALEDIAKMVDYAIVKIGKDGSMVMHNGEKYKAGVINVVPMDTTGAGDLFASGFIYGLSKGLSLDKCLQIGAIPSGKVIEVMGPKLSESTWTDVKQRIEEVENA